MMSSTFAVVEVGRGALAKAASPRSDDRPAERNGDFNSVPCDFNASGAILRNAPAFPILSVRAAIRGDRSIRRGRAEPSRYSVRDPDASVFKGSIPMTRPRPTFGRGNALNKP